MLTFRNLSLSSQVQAKVRVSVCGLCARGVQVRGHPAGDHRAGQQPARARTGNGYQRGEEDLPVADSAAGESVVSRLTRVMRLF